MVIDDFYDAKSNNAIPYYMQMIHSSSPTLIFNSEPLSLAFRPKRETLAEMGLLGKSFENSLTRKTRADVFETRSGSENFESASGDDQELENKSSKRKKYHRHTPFQIQELEACFKENPHPDEKSRLELGNRLGLEVRQVKFWFQNRRTQIKTQLDRHENSILKQENDKLRIENITMKEAMRSPICNNCGGPAVLGEVPIENHHLMVENARLKDELNRLGVLANKFLGSSTGHIPPVVGNSRLDIGICRGGFGGLNFMELPGLDLSSRDSNAFPIVSQSGRAMGMAGVDISINKSNFHDLALAAMDELMELSQVDSPLWFHNFEGDAESLNLEHYRKTFSTCQGVSFGNFTTEATRCTGTVLLDSEALVESLMDVNRWTEMFPWIIGSASIVDVISTGTGEKQNGALLLIEAELQVLSPLVPVRQLKFIRFCKKNTDDIWAVVDVSIDGIFQNTIGNAPVNCRRRPSGVVVQDMPNGCSKVTWIEHNEYSENSVHQIFKPLLRSGMCFGALKWISTLQKQCELVSIIMSSTNLDEDHLAVPPSSKKTIVKLAQRMARNFCTGICATVHKWEIIQAENMDDTKLMVRRSFGDLGEPQGLILSATTTIWMPVSQQLLFDFLHNEKTRFHWDFLSQDGTMQQILHMPKCHKLGNSISILRSNVITADADQNGVVILQDTISDSTGSLIVHAAVDTTALDMVMSGGDSLDVSFLPSGFAIFPDSGKSNEGGSLLTMGFQILVNNMPAAKLNMESIDTVKSLIARTLQGIKTGLQSN